MDQGIMLNLLKILTLVDPALEGDVRLGKPFKGRPVWPSG